MESRRGRGGRGGMRKGGSEGVGRREREEGQS